MVLSCVFKSKKEYETKGGLVCRRGRLRDKEDEMVFFFFKQKTAYEIGTGDWSSDVCSSDLIFDFCRLFYLIPH